MTPKHKRLWRTNQPNMVFPADNLMTVIELLRAYIGTMTAPHEIVIESPKGRQWKLIEGAPMERRYCIRLPDQQTSEEHD